MLKIDLRRKKRNSNRISSTNNWYLLKLANKELKKTLSLLNHY